METTPDGQTSPESTMLFKQRDKLGRPLVVAHRGYAHGEHFEHNTLSAFELAVDLGAEGLEGDVRRTADERFVIHHDPFIRRGLRVRRITSHSYDELTRFVGGRDNLPLLDDILSLLNRDLPFFLQVKSQDDALPVVKHLKATTSMQENIHLMGYLSNIIMELNDAPFSLGKHYVLPMMRNIRIIDQLSGSADRLQIASPFYGLLTEGHYRQLGELDYMTVLYTINSEKALSKYLQSHATAIYTDRLVRAKKIISSL